MSFSVHLRSKPFLFALGAGCAGFALNQFEMPVFGGTPFVFGGFFSLLTAFILGPAYGGLAALVAFSSTWMAWQHPASLVCYTLEAVVVGWLVSRRRMAPVQATSLYWLVLGGPLLFVFLLWLKDIPFPSNWAILIKYPLNGILVAAIALPASNSSRLRRWLGLEEPDDSGTPLQRVLFRRVGILATLPLTMLILLMGQKFDRTLLANADSSLRNDTKELANQIEQQLVEHQNALVTLARQFEAEGIKPADFFDRMDVLRRQYPGFLTLLVADGKGEIVATAPLVDAEGEPLAHRGLTVADREYFRHPMATSRPYVSNVFRGRGFGNDLIVAISVPVFGMNGSVQYILEGSLKLTAILDALAASNRLEGRSLLTVDRAQNVVFSTGEVHLPTLSSLVNHPLQRASPHEEQVAPFDWQQAGGRRAERQLAASCQIRTCGWRIIMLEPIWNTQRTIAAFYAVTFFWGLLAIGLSLWLARNTAGEITQSLKQIAEATQALVNQEPKLLKRPELFPSREFAIISADLHNAASALSKSNRQLAGAIGERDQSHRQLRQVLMHLDEKVRERTTQLEEARRAAESANNGKSEFLASMSHELRTPLNVILGMSEILREQYQGTLTERQMECVAAVEESGRHLLALINDILDLSKIESGMMDLELQETRVRDVCEASLRLVREAAMRKSIRLGVSYTQSASTLTADARRLKQILVNLLSNAVKFTPNGGSVTLAVSQAGAPDRIYFAVEDTGIGIDPRHQDKLFQPFQQIDSALNRKYAGTGLGLSLVKRMAQMHGGAVEVVSESGKGARFTVSLPLGDAKAGQAAPTQIELMPRGRTQAPIITGEPLILIAEDNPINVQVYTGHLGRSNCRFSFATNGHEAIERALADHPDLVLMDVQMPEMDGLEAIRRLRADARTAGLPIIAVTALARPEDRIRCLEAGADSYLSKPVSLKYLTGQIVELLAPKAASTPADSPALHS